MHLGCLGLALYSLLAAAEGAPDGIAGARDDTWAPEVPGEATFAGDTAQNPLPWQAFSGDAESAPPVRVGGAILSRVHYRMREVAAGAWYDRRALPAGFARVENTLRLNLTATTGRLQGVAQIDFDWLPINQRSEIHTVADLSHREKIQPYRLDVHALYVDLTDVFVEGVDLRLGQQKIMWGKADQFNPTNTLNPIDMENPLLFGQRLANMMARLDYHAVGEWGASLVWVPVFRPAVLPHSAELGLVNVGRLPFDDDGLRYRLHTEREMAAAVGYPTVVSRVVPNVPGFSASNMQWGARLTGVLANQDVALSYAYGRMDIPVPASNHVRQRVTPRCHPADDTRCIQGVLETEVHLAYPRVHVVGFNVAGETPLLPVGYRLELGVFVPEAQRFTVTQDEVSVLGITQPAGEYAYGPRGRPVVLRDTPFAKWTVGLDYTFSRHVYANAMWVHGMPDELGARSFFGGGKAIRDGGITGDVDDALRCVINQTYDTCAREAYRRPIGDYAVLGLDLRFLDQQGLLRLFAIVDLGGITYESWNAAMGRRQREHFAFYTPEGYSITLYPELSYNFGDGFLASVGALLLLGDSVSRFGDPAAGGSLAWLRAEYRY